MFLTLVLALASVAHAQPDAAASTNDFATRLYTELSRKPGNVFFSPYNISDALALAYTGARGETAREMETMMGIRVPPEKFHSDFSQLDAKMTGTGKPYQLFFANRLWGERNFDFAPAFLSTVEKHYRAGLEKVDFQRDPDRARQTINQWVQQKTQDRIKDLLSSGDVNNETRLVLTSAIYFKSAWASQFDRKRTAQGPFQLTAKQSIQVPMMRNSTRAMLLNSPDWIMLELPYEKRELSMIIIMPAAVDGLPAIEKNLTMAEINKRHAAMRMFDVDVMLPRFKTTSEYKLRESFEALGLRSAWIPGKADFSGMMSDGSRKLYLGAAVHKAFVDVNEDGTEAAAATALGMQLTSALQQGKFHADRPFMYLIRHAATGSILFMGRVTDPR